MSVLSGTVKDVPLSFYLVVVMLMESVRPIG